jgi:hypothetical protein
MPHEIFIKLDGSKYGEGVMLNEHNDEYSLVAAAKPTRSMGTVYKKWCFPEINGVPITTSIPLGVKLGGHRQAVKILKNILIQLGEDV